MEKENKEIYISDYQDDESLCHYGKGHLEGGNSGRYPWGSGESPYQTSNDFYSRVRELEKEGMKETEIAEALGMTTTSLRTAKAIAKNDVRSQKITYIRQLQKQGYNNVEIGKKLGEKFNKDGSPVNESVVRSLLNENAETRMNIASKTADELRDIVDDKEFIDIGSGTEKSLNKGLGITSTKMKEAVDILVMDGYEVYTIKTEQVTNKGNWTNVKVLCKPGTKYSDVYKARDEGRIKSVVDYAENITRDDERPSGFIYPASLDSKRLVIRYDEDGGTLKDGVVEIRPGVKDLSLGGSHYSQVRILVDGTHYIKGMAVYGKEEDFPEGVDLIFNSNKSKAKIGDNKLEALKPIDENLKKDPTNPFGSAIKELGGQSFYNDPNGKYVNPITGEKQSLSLINKRSDEGDWNDWSKELPSQFLSKQPLSLIRKQIKLSEEDKQSEYEEIMSLTNPTVKRALLEEFADDCDAAAVNLKAASLPGQSYKVILPLTTIKDDEIYAPHLPNGSKVALVRYPHGGTFEIPYLTVNNNNQEGRDTLSTTPSDAIGISKKVADQLSGADFDGDTVMVIPTSKYVSITHKHPLKDLEGFDTKLAYGCDKDSKVTIDGVDYASRNGQQYKRMTQTQLEMGKISNLITDMTLRGASDEELARAVKHSMVVIDAEKHWLDYEASYKDNNILQLKKKYQGRVNPETGKMKFGAATLISRAKSPVTPNERKEGGYFTKDTNEQVDLIETEDKTKRLYMNPKTGVVYEADKVYPSKFNPLTGEKAYTYTNRTYSRVTYIGNDGKKKETAGIIKDNKMYFKNDDGEYEEVTTQKVTTKYAPSPYKSSQMAEVSDARELVSEARTQQEEAYADYANKLKALANSARKESFAIEDIPYSASAHETYKNECDTLEYKYNQALANKPKERQAQLIAGSRIKAMVQDNPELEIDEDHLNKLRQAELRKARIQVGASRQEIYIDDKEWEAIQAGAVSKTRLRNIIANANSDRLKELAMPRSKTVLSTSKINRIKSMSNMGYTTDQIAKFLGVSPNTVTKYLSGKE